MDSRVVHIDIHGQRYSVRTELEPQYILELATYLDEKMQLAARELTTADPLRVAIIAALNVADELFRSQADATGFEGQITSRTAEMERLVDSVLADVHPKAVGADQ